MNPNDRNYHWHAEETYKSLIQISLSALRFVVLANGGAAIAILAFLGQSQSGFTVQGEIRCAMQSFLTGVFLGGVAHVCSYLTQLRLYSETLDRSDQQGPFQHSVLLWAGVICVSLGIVLFGYGSWIATYAFTSPTPAA